jgi:predicted house-cleaning noncanonical NTP pyrophosphatase (MazG superfamily)
MIEIKAMFTEKSDELQKIEQSHKAEHEHLNTYQDGYSEGFSDGWDKAINNVQVILKRYSIGGEKSDLKPVAKGIRPAEFYGQIEKLKEEIAEVVEAWNDGQGRGRIAEELADLQQACETAMAMLGLSEDERSKVRKKVLLKNASRGYYGEHHAS